MQVNATETSLIEVGCREVKIRRKEKLQEKVTARQPGKGPENCGKKQPGREPEYPSASESKWEEKGKVHLTGGVHKESEEKRRR